MTKVKNKVQTVEELIDETFQLPYAYIKECDSMEDVFLKLNKYICGVSIFHIEEVFSKKDHSEVINNELAFVYVFSVLFVEKFLNLKVSEVEKLVVEERIRQDAKFGVQNHNIKIWMLILGEEVGELAKAILETKFCNEKDVLEFYLEKVKKEAIQVSAVAKAMLECFEIKEIK